MTIRGQPLTVHEALDRSLAHASYHVGQIVYLAHSIRGDGWRYLSIAPGGSPPKRQSDPRKATGLCPRSRRPDLTQESLAIMRKSCSRSVPW